MPLKLDYFYGGETEQYSFYLIPKVLFTDQSYSTMTMEARVLYGLLLDRMSLSARNGWLDSFGRVFIYFTLEDVLHHGTLHRGVLQCDAGRQRAHLQGAGRDQEMDTGAEGRQDVSGIPPRVQTPLRLDSRGQDQREPVLRVEREGTREKKAECDSGKITFEEFRDWLARP